MHTHTTGTGHVGDRLAAFSVLLPAEPAGEVLIVARPEVGAALGRRFPRARVHRPADALPGSGSVGLLILDERLLTPATRQGLVGALTPDAVVATIGDRGDLLVYPDFEHPEQLWRRGWPVSGVTDRRAQVRRALGLGAARFRDTPRLRLSGPPFVSLADRVGVEAGHQLDDVLTLVGVVTAGHTVLRYRGTRQEIAVHLSCTDPDPDLTVSERVAEEVPGVAGLVAPTLARGRTCGHPWSASAWVPTPWSPLPRRRTRQRLRRALPELAGRLAATPLGVTGAGWSDAWLAEVDLVPVADRETMAAALRRLESGLPTGWCHGDPWPANVLDRGHDVVIIDWDNATPDAPLGLDRLLIAAFARSGAEQVTVVEACARLVDDPELAAGPGDDAVAGVPWPEWDRSTRSALALAAGLRYLRNRSLHDLGEDLLASELDRLRALAERATAPDTEPAVEAAPGPPVAPDAEPEPRAEASGPSEISGSGTIRGAGWLGLGAGVVKAAQTIVLLILAALLAPSDIGVLAIGALVLNVTSAITDLGSSTALVYWRGDVERAARSALSLALGLAVVLTTGVWLAAPWLSETLNGGEIGVDVIRGLMLCLPMFAVAGVSQELLRRALAFKRRVLPDIVGALTGAVVSVLLATAGYGAMSLVAGQLVQAALVMGICWAVRPPVRLGWDLGDLSGLVSYGGHLAGASVVQLLMLNVDYLLVAHRLGSDELGIYSMAFRLGYMPYLLVGVVISSAAFAHLCRLRDREVGRAAGDSALAMLALVLPLYLGVILLAPQLELLGSQWAPGVAALRWLAAYGIVLSLIRMCLVTLNAVSRTRDSFLLNLAHLVLLTGLLAWWVGLGVEMVALGQLVAGVGTLALAIAVLGRHVEGIDWRLLARRGAPLAVGAITMSITALALGQLMPWTRVSFPGLALVGSLALAAYLVPVLALDRAGLISLPAALRRRP